MPDRQIDDVMELVVDSDAFLPAMFCLTILDAGMEYVDSKTFEIGAAVKITIKGENFVGNDVEAEVFVGEITSIEPYFSPSGVVHLQIRGYDRSHRLTSGKKTCVFGGGNPDEKPITDEDIVRKIADTAGFSAEVSQKSLKYHYVLQHDQTDWEFLWARARLVGCQVYVNDQKLYFKSASETRGGDAGDLEWGKNLTSFQPSVTVMGQITKSTVYGWDPAKKAAIQGIASSSSASNAPAIGLGKTGSALKKSAFGEAASDSFVIPPIDQSHAKDMADAALSAAESDFIRGEGFCHVGDPRLLAGRKVNIKGLGTKFSGKYYITNARHTWKKEGYSVNFSVSGSSPASIFHLLNTDQHQNPGEINGLVTGVVTNNKDPDKLGRVRVKFPWLPKMNGAEVESDWARLAVPGGGKERGIFFTPEVDDEVLVAFDHGDINYPYIVGALWNKKDKPPEGTADIIEGSKVNQRVIRSLSGHLIILDDKKGEEKIIIQDKTGKNSFAINSKDNSMKIASQGDLLIETGGKFTVNSKGDMAFDSKASGKIATQTAFNIEAKTEATVKAGQNQLALKPAGVELSGLKVDIKSNTMASISASAMLEIKGALVKIN